MHPFQKTERNEEVHLEWAFGNEMLVKVLCTTLIILKVIHYSFYLCVNE